MTADELASRQRKAMSLSVTVVEDGYSVPSSDGGEYIVSYADDGRLVCKCIDFVIHKADLDWQCKHILAVTLFLQRNSISRPSPTKPVKKNVSRYDVIDLG
jgi:hypothetical protein